MPRPLLAILAASFVLKCLLLIPAHTIEPFYDSSDYVGAAVRLARTGEFRSLRAPAYPAVLAAVFRSADALGLPMRPVPGAPAGLTGLDLARMLQVVIGTVTAGLLYLLSRRFFDRRASLAAAAIFAFYPNLVGYSHYLWSETTFLLLFVGGLLLAVWTARTRRLRWALACGAVLGLASLTRQIGLVVVAVSAAWIWIDVTTGGRGPRWRFPFLRDLADRRTATGLAAVVVLGALLVVLPWTVRNTLHHGEMVLISASGGVGLLFGATDDPLGEVRRLGDPSLRFDPLRRDRRCGERAREIIAADPAGWVQRCLTHNLPSLFEPVFDGVMTHVLRPGKGYGVVPVWIARTVLVLLVMAYATLVFCAVLGGWLGGNRRYVLFFLMLLVSYLAAHTTILGVTRHRLPLETMIMPFAGYLVTRESFELRAQLTARRLAGIALTFLLFAGMVSMSNTDRAAQYWRRAEIIAERV